MDDIDVLERVAFNGTALHIHGWYQREISDLDRCLQLVISSTSYNLVITIGFSGVIQAAKPSRCNISIWFSVLWSRRVRLFYFLRNGINRPVFCTISVTLWKKYSDSLKTSVHYTNTAKNHGIDIFESAIEPILMKLQTIKVSFLYISFSILL